MSALGVARTRPRVSTRHLPVLLLAAVFVVAAIVIMHAGRDTTFYFDDWNFVLNRIGWRPHVLLYPHNEHFSLVPVLVYKVLLSIFGLDHYGPFRVAALLFNLLIGGLLFVYVRRRLGDWVALGLTASVVMAGASAWDIVWPFQIGFLGSLASGLAALLLIDNNTRRSDIAAAAMLAISLSSSSQGMAFLAAVIVETVLRPDRFKRFWVPLLPAVYYGAWYLKYGNSTIKWSDGILFFPHTLHTGFSAGVTAATGLPAQYAGVLGLSLIVVVVYSLTRADAITLPRLAAVVTLPLVFWLLIALARTFVPGDEPRYMYPTTLYVVLLATEALRPFRPGTRVGVAIALILGFGVLSNAQNLNTVGNGLRAGASQARSYLTAAEMLKGKLGPDIGLIPDQPSAAAFTQE